MKGLIWLGCCELQSLDHSNFENQLGKFRFERVVHGYGLVGVVGVDGVEGALLFSSSGNKFKSEMITYCTSF